MTSGTTRTVLDRLAVGVLLIAGWQVASMMTGEYWIASPWSTLGRVLALAGDGQLGMHAAYTLRSAIIGFVIGFVPGLVLPFLLRRSPILTAIIAPYMMAGYGIPKLALAPLFILWFGIGIESKIAVVAIVTFFLVYYNTTAGVRALDVRLVRMAQVAGASEAQVARKIVWPAAAPYVLAGVRISTPYAIGGAVIAELISSNRGLGYLVQLGAANFDTKTVFAALAATTVIVLGANWLVGAAERYFLRWRPASGPLGEI